MPVTTLSQKSSIEPFSHIVDNTATVDVFGDGSGIELLTLNGNLDSYSHGSLTLKEGTITYDVGEFAQAIKGDGATIIEGLENFSFTGDETSDCTISFWVKPVGNIDGDFDLLFQYRHDLWGDIYAGVESGDAQGDPDSFSVYMGVNGDPLTKKSDEIDFNSWHHCIVEYDMTHGKARAYFDGVLEVVADVTERNSDFDAYGDGLSLCGTICCTSDTKYYSKASVDQIRFINRALSSDGTEVQLLGAERSVGKGGITQKSLIGSYVQPFVQLENQEANDKSTLEQKQTEYAIVFNSFEQQGTVLNLDVIAFEQKSELRDHPSYIFAQSSGVEPYRPYSSLVHIADIGAGIAIRHSEFESDIKLIGGGSDYKYQGVLKFNNAAPFGTGFHFSDGATVLIDVLSDTNGVNGTFFLWSFWVNIADDELLNFPDDYKTVALMLMDDVDGGSEYLYIGFDNEDFYIESNNGLYQSKVDVVVNQLQNIQFHVVDSYLSVYVNGKLAFECDWDIHSGVAYTGICYGAEPEEGTISEGGDYTCFLENTTVDQVRFINDSVPIKKVYEVHKEHLVTAPFIQKSTAHSNHRKSIIQESSVGDLYTAPFEQKSWFIQGKASIFAQTSTIGYFSKFSTFKQVQTVHKDVEVVIIKRIEA